MTLTLRPAEEYSAAFAGAYSGLELMGLPVMRVSIDPGDRIVVPEGYVAEVSSLRPVYLEEHDPQGFPRILPAELIPPGRYTLEGNLIRSSMIF